MPPTVQRKIARLYRFSELINQKRDSENRPRREIIDDLCTLLEVSYDHWKKIHSCRQGESGFLSVNKLKLVALYFKCTVDDLLTQDLHSPSFPPGTDVSKSGTGNS